MTNSIEAKPNSFDSPVVDVAAVVLAAISALVVGDYLHQIRWLVPADLGVVYSALVGLHGALLGFVLAALAITIGYAMSPALTIVRESGQLRNLYRVFFASTVTEAVNVVACLLGLVIIGVPTLSRVWAVAAVLLGALAVVRIARTLWVVFAVVNAVKSATD